MDIDRSISQLAGQKKAQEKHEAEILEEAKKLKDFLEKEDTVVELKAKAGEDSRLFGSIPSKQINGLGFLVRFFVYLI